MALETAAEVSTICRTPLDELAQFSRSMVPQQAHVVGLQREGNTKIERDGHVYMRLMEGNYGA